VSEQRESTTNDPRIAAVLPWSAYEHHTFESIVEHLDDGIGRASASVLHQHETDGAKVFDGDAVDLTRFFASK
jgi:hypothetical protein